VKIGHLLWLAPVLVGCSSTTPKGQQTSAMTESYPQFNWLQHADSEKDALAAIARKDYRLLAISGRGNMLPGVKPELAEQAKKQCKERFMDGMGDTLRDKEHRKLWKKGRDYAVAYNTIILKSCLKN
jgi:hypothetical protein